MLGEVMGNLDKTFGPSGEWVSPRCIWASPEIVARIKAWANDKDTSCYDDEDGLLDFTGIRVIKSASVPPEKVFMVNPDDFKIEPPCSKVRPFFQWHKKEAQIALDLQMKKLMVTHTSDTFKYSMMGCPSVIARYNKWYRRLWRPIRLYFNILFWKIGVIARARLKSFGFNLE